MQGVGDGEDAVVRDVEVEGERHAPVAPIDAQRAADVVERHALEEAAARAQAVDLPDDLRGRCGRCRRCSS